MKIRMVTGILLGLSTAFLFGCAGMHAQEQPLQFAAQTFDSGQYVSKVDSFQIIMDASMTMGNRNAVDFHSAKNFISAVNQSLPADLNVAGGLRSFGHSDRQSKNLTDLQYGMTRYSAAGLADGLGKVRYAGGNSPLAAALDAAAVDLKGAGKTSVVVVSDGLQMDSAPAAAANLKAALGEQACIYTVWIGDDPAGQKLLQRVANEGGCGAAYAGADLASAAAFSGFVKEAFLAGKPAPAPAPAPKAAPVPPAPVVKKEVVTFNLLFGFDKADITDEMIPILEQAKMILNEDTSVRFTVAGHTDSTGPEVYNQGLSERRAKAVRDWLVNNGIAASRLDVAGYGETMPKYDNATREGRKLNRRVELESR
ncbi:MAG: OmpA family protein [Desulfuromonadales bacterium]|nr:OmpA family protein [Desulfuromonadales bacterium]